jgi:hypothetical protein
MRTRLGEAEGGEKKNKERWMKREMGKTTE